MERFQFKLSDQSNSLPEEHNKIIFIAELTNGKYIVHWMMENKKHEVDYEIDDVKDCIKKGSWILV